MRERSGMFLALDSSDGRSDPQNVIPTLLLFGVLFGRWWRIAIPIATLGWPILLITSGVDSGVLFAIGASLLAAANATVGVLVNRAVAIIGRQVLSSARR